MSKSKRISIILILTLLLGAYFIIPLIDNFSPQQPNDVVEEELAHFDFLDNFTLKYGAEKKMSFTVLSPKVSKIELVISDKLIQTWTKPNGKIHFDFNTKMLLLGAQEVKINIFKDNTLHSEDSRLIRVLSDIIPKQIIAKVKSLSPHNPLNFTQGLEFYNNQLFESTGQYGESKVMKLDLSTGNSTKSIDVESTCFGEGITVMNDKMYEITWKEQKCFVYEVNSLTLEKTIGYVGEGWGLCNDGKNILMSDGSERIYFRDPNTFEITRTIEVYNNKGPIINLNELEYIDGKIYANVWQANYIVVIDPFVGKVEEIIDCTEVIGQARGNGEVLNGIAFNKKTKQLYFTGKNWSKIAEVKL
jgi:glutamine cyclotransferase